MTKIHCNNTNCQATFEVDESRSSSFFGSSAVRTKEFHTCPNCGHTDSHWFYAIDEMPIFEGSEGKIRRLQNDWIEEN